MNPQKANVIGITNKSFIEVMSLYEENINIEEAKTYLINYLNKKQSFIIYNIKAALIGDVIIFKREI